MSRSGSLGLRGQCLTHTPFYHEPPASCQPLRQQNCTISEQRWNGRRGDSSTRWESNRRVAACYTAPSGITVAAGVPPCETQVVAADTAASTEGADRFPRILSPSGEADPPFAKRATSRQRLPVRAPRELASFVREFPHKEFQSGVRAAETVSGGAVALESALASASASPLASGLSLVLGLSSALA